MRFAAQRKQDYATYCQPVRPPQAFGGNPRDPPQARLQSHTPSRRFIGKTLYVITK